MSAQARVGPAPPVGAAGAPFGVYLAEADPACVVLAAIGSRSLNQHGPNHLPGFAAATGVRHNTGTSILPAYRVLKGPGRDTIEAAAVGRQQ